MSMYTGDLSLEDRRTFWRAYESLSALFGAEAIDTGLMSLRPTEVVEIYASPLDGPRYPVVVRIVASASTSHNASLSAGTSM